MKCLSLSLMQTKQECKLIYSAEAKTEGKIGPSVIHQGAIAVLVVRGHRKWKNPSYCMQPTLIRGQKPD